MSRVLVVGPPAAGKSEVCRDLCAAMPSTFSYAWLDEDVTALTSEHGWPGVLADQHVDAAVTRLIRRSKGASALVELAHHDYLTLFARGGFNLSDFDFIVLLTAPLEVLIERNRRRASPVPDLYVSRCFGALAALAENLKISGTTRWLSVDTSLFSSRHTVEFITTVLKQPSSPRLSQLVVVPVPAAPHLGGHFVSSVEWSDELVKDLIRRYEVTSALDVGCGAGLSLDLFDALGVRCWGLEGNATVLDGPSRFKERLFIVDFHKQSVRLPCKVDLVWCVEVLEHIPEQHSENVVKTIVENAGRAIFVSAAPPDQPGYFHVNCQPKSYWIERFERHGLRYVSTTDEILSHVRDDGLFGHNPLRHNGMLFEVN